MRDAKKTRPRRCAPVPIARTYEGTVRAVDVPRGCGFLARVGSSPGQTAVAMRREQLHHTEILVEKTRNLQHLVDLQSHLLKLCIGIKGT